MCVLAVTAQTADHCHAAFLCPGRTLTCKVMYDDLPQLKLRGQRMCICPGHAPLQALMKGSFDQPEA